MSVLAGTAVSAIGDTSRSDNLQRLLSRSGLPSRSNGSLTASLAPVPLMTTTASSSTAVTPTNLPLITEHPLHPMLNQVIQEMKQMREEFRKNLGKVQEEQKRMGTALVKAMEASFTIEDSPYKEPLSIEIATLYCTTTNRKPSKIEIADKIGAVLGIMSGNDMKVAKAKIFCNNRLTELRSEERRRLFGTKPCEHYSKLSTREFAERFCRGLKVSQEHQNIYVKNLALLRLFARSVADPRRDTFKQFRKWTSDTFKDDPSLQEMEAILEADAAINYNIPEPRDRQEPVTLTPENTS